MRLLAVICFVTVSVIAQAQTFSRREIIQLPQLLTAVQTEFVSLDADSLMDLVITGTTSTNELIILPFSNRKSNPWFNLKPQVPTNMRDGKLHIVDWNVDHKFDLLFSGRNANGIASIVVMKATGLTGFQPAEEILIHNGLFTTTDLNNDGHPDIITGSANSLKFFKNTTDPLEMMLEIKGITPTDIAVFDLNNDGQKDVVVSGIEDFKPLTAIFINRGDFVYGRKEVLNDVDGAISINDVTADGRFDITVAGKNAGGTFETGIWINNSEDFTKQTPATSPFTPTLFSGDLNSDGKPDQLLSGKDAQQRNQSFIRQHDGTIVGLDTTGLMIQRMGDQDRDGDLDLVQVTDSIGFQWLKFYENTTEIINQRPGTPNGAFAISTFKRTFLFWQLVTDDHTANPSLTYDVWLGNGTETLIAPSFDLDHRLRNVVTHGNAGTVNSLMIDGLSDDRYFFMVQAVDNAYYGSRCSGGGVLPCFDLAHTDMDVCKGSDVTLSSFNSAFWFSTTRGALGQSPTLSFIADQADTIFSFVPQQKDCSKNKVYVIHVHNQPSIQLAAAGYQIIVGNSVQLEVSGDATQWEWTPGESLNDPNVRNPVASPLTTTEYTVTGSNEGCSTSANVQVIVQETAFVPNLFTPNGDGKNDNLVIYGLGYASNFAFRIFNREGSTVYETKDISHATSSGWNGHVQGTRQPSGVYYWKVVGETAGGQKLLLNGTSTGSILLVH